MAEFWVTHSLNNTTAVKFNISLRYFVLKGSRGDHKWVLEIGTTYPDANGDDISATKIHNISAEDLDEIIETAVANMCAQIDWSPLVPDVDAPYVYSASPTGSGVSLYSDVLLTLKEILPSAGMDLSSMKIILNNSVTDFDITSEVVVEGDPYESYLKWSPALRIRSTYD
jgi:hypothetical protein